MANLEELKAKANELLQPHLSKQIQAKLRLSKIRVNTARFMYIASYSFLGIYIGFLCLCILQGKPIGTSTVTLAPALILCITSSRKSYLATLAAARPPAAR